ncbi:MAG: MBL fold metallo-hydrolase [Ktedonobacteraceae bacterium]|nr:MBL fold metallo-hydrolase [Ktedonobacteraceae bacterium]
MPHKILPGFYRLPIPLPDNPLGTVNVYVVIGKDGVRLIDCGWNTPEAYATLADELQTLGTRIDDIREIVITHIHPDHFGLTERLVKETGARYRMHRLEAVYIGTRYEHTQALIEEMEAWLRVNGVPQSELEVMAKDSLLMVMRVGTRLPDVLLEGNETLQWLPYRFEVIWTPGHSSGHICLYEPQSRVLVSGDHVLEHISPHIGLHTQSFSNPLGDYLSSLQLVRNLPVEMILPGHGVPFEDLAGRVDVVLTLRNGGSKVGREGFPREGQDDAESKTNIHEGIQAGSRADASKPAGNRRRKSHEIWAYLIVYSAIGACVLQNTGKRHFLEVDIFLHLRKRTADYSGKMNSCGRSETC